MTLSGLALALASLAWTGSASASDRALYYGGRVISNVNVVVVFWTSAVVATTQSQIGPFLTAITASPYIDWLEEYDTLGLDGQDMLPGSNQHIGRGTLAETVTITPVNTSTSLLDSDIQVELFGQINSEALPAPVTDGSGNVNTLYMIEFPPGYLIDLGGKTSCSNFCGYHSTISISGPKLPAPLSVPYAVLPDIGTCGGSCGSGFDEVTSIHSHELVEAITDTEAGLVTGTAFARPLAWYDPGDNMELADICAPFDSAPGVMGGTAVVAGYTVQLIWSDFAGACVATIPICDGTVAAPACRPCTTYDNGVDCAGATPVCQTSTTAENAGECVGCLDDTACLAPTPVCNVATNTCRACVATDCTGATPICGTNGACVECDATNDSACTGATAVCDVPTGQCVGCVSSGDCVGHTPVCDPTTNTCQACKGSTECPTGQVCDTSSDGEEGECVDCNTNEDCAHPGSTCQPKTHRCLLPVPEAGAPPPDAGPPAKLPETPAATGSGCSCRTAPWRGSACWGVGATLAACGVALRRRRRLGGSPLDTPRRRELGER